MDRELNILSYIPNVLKEVKELKAIATAENPEITSLWAAIENALNDQFILTSTEYGVKRREKIMKITPKGTDTLDERKFRILVKSNEQLPYSFRALHQQLRSLCGPEGYTFTRNVTEKTVTVKVALTAKSNFNDVGDLLERVLPSNIIIELTLLYNQHQTMSTKAHSQLAFFTHDEIRNEVI